MTSAPYEGVIYKIELTIDQKSYVYIGATKNEAKRAADWNNLNKPYAGKKINLARAKYGLQAFTRSVV